MFYILSLMKVDNIYGSDTLPVCNESVIEFLRIFLFINFKPMNEHNMTFITIINIFLSFFSFVSLQHFVCAKCEKPFFGHRHYEKKGLAYCEIHYHQLFGNLCFVCNQVIAGDGNRIIIQFT